VGVARSAGQTTGGREGESIWAESAKKGGALRHTGAHIIQNIDEEEPAAWMGEWYRWKKRDAKRANSQRGEGPHPN